MTATQHWTHSETDLLAYLSGDLDAASCERFELHLQECASCRATVVAQMEQLEEEPQLEPALQRRMQAEFVDLLHASDRSPRRASRRPFYLLAAALTLSVLVSVLILRRPAEPLDGATLELLARADEALPKSLQDPLWTPVSTRSMQPPRTMGDETADTDFGQMLADLERAEALRPDQPELRLTLAHTQLAAGDPIAAERNYRELLGRREQSGRARIGLAAVLYARDELSEAIEVLEQIPDSAAEAQAALYDQALLHLELGNRARAQELTDRYRERFNEDIWLQDLEFRLSKPSGR